MKSDTEVVGYETCEMFFVEDSEEDYYSMRRAMKSLGVTRTYERHRSGERALHALEERVAQGEALPHLVVLDLNLPGIGGVGFLRAIRGNPELAGLRVAVLSTSDNPRDVSACSSLGVTGYFIKPVEFEDLKNVLADIARIC